MLTRIFKSGNSLAVRIPKEMTFPEATQEVSIERMGDGLFIRPASRRSLAGLMDKFAAFSPDFMAEGREFHEEHEREGW
ncbi:MAG: type II toxin-antitoxin system VapB family antitoxin [Sulfuricellaceae bacterium]|jgi:antitoxin VapB